MIIKELLALNEAKSSNPHAAFLKDAAQAIGAKFSHKKTGSRAQSISDDSSKEAVAAHEKRLKDLEAAAKKHGFKKQGFLKSSPDMHRFVHPETKVKLTINSFKDYDEAAGNHHWLTSATLSKAE